jgi:hypothetical protein
MPARVRIMMMSERATRSSERGDDDATASIIISLIS